MREQYITKSLIKKRFNEFKVLLGKDKKIKEFLEEREQMVCSTRTKETRKYLFFETISIINNPYRWKQIT